MLKRFCVTLATCLALTGFAGAQVFNVSLDGGQEVPPTGSPGTGDAVVTLDAGAGTVSVTGSYTGLLGSQSAAHIHRAPAGQNGSIIIGLSGTGGTTGTFSGSGSLSPAEVQDMLDGLTYLNVHSSMFPAGEIRGQIEGATCVPAMETSGLLILAVLLALVGGAVIWRRSVPKAA